MRKVAIVEILPHPTALAREPIGACVIANMAVGEAVGRCDAGMYNCLSIENKQIMKIEKDLRDRHE